MERWVPWLRTTASASLVALIALMVFARFR